MMTFDGISSFGEAFVGRSRACRLRRRGHIGHLSQFRHVQPLTADGVRHPFYSSSSCGDIIGQVKLNSRSGWRASRRTIIVASVLALAASAAIAIASIEATAGQSAGVSLPNGHQRTLLVRYARNFAREANDPTVSKATVVATRYAAFRRLVADTYGGKPVTPDDRSGAASSDADAPVFVVALRGDFTDFGAPRPRGTPAPVGMQIVAVLDANSDLPLRDWYVLGSPLDVTSLGQTETLSLARR